MNQDELKNFLIDVLDEVFVANPTEIAPRWRSGKLILEPGNDTQSKEIPIDVFFRKLIHARDSLRVLEQKITSHESLSSDEKLSLQSYISKVFGTLTTFNILFKEGKDKFIGSGQKAKVGEEKELSMAEAKKKLGLNEY